MMRTTANQASGLERPSKRRARTVMWQGCFGLTLTVPMKASFEYTSQVLVLRLQKSEKKSMPHSVPQWGVAAMDALTMPCLAC